MTTLHRRSHARIAAVIDCVFNFLFMTAVVVLIVMVTTELSKESEGHSIFVGIVIELAISGLIYMLLFCLSVRLINATEVSEQFDHQKAKTVATMWKNAQISVLVLTLLSVFRGGNSLFAIPINLAIRCPLIYVVHRFIHELEKVMTNPTTWKPDTDTV